MRGDGSLFRRGRIWWAVHYVEGKRIQLSLKTTDERRARIALKELVGARRHHVSVRGAEGRVLAWPSFGALAASEASGPLVYAWVRRDVVLYIGMSAKGLGRPFSPQHGKLGGNLGQDDRLLVFRCASDHHAKTVEGALIRRVRPPLNGVR